MSSNYDLTWVLRKFDTLYFDPDRVYGSLDPVVPVQRVHVLPPIIIVSSSTIINANNITEFMQEGRYVRIGEKMKSARSEIRHNNGKYVICNMPELLTLSEWERVVCVVVDGRSWQFTDFPAPYNDPVYLFNKVCGIHFVFDKSGGFGVGGGVSTMEKANASARDWDVSILRVPVDDRTMDGALCSQVWHILNVFARVKAPWMHDAAMCV
jgi:hypothetical protein